MEKENPSQRSVKISSDERGGWSSDRPRPGGGPQRGPNLAVRCQVLSPAESLRYSPGSLLVLVSPSQSEASALAERAIQEAGPLLSLDRCRSLLAGKVADDELEAKASELLQAALEKRLKSGDAVAIATDGFEPDERTSYTAVAARHRRPCHFVLVEAGSDELSDEDRPSLNKLRRRLEAGELGAEGFNTAVRLGGASLAELRRIVFAPPPSDD